ncbi:hypothethical protein [Ralstonia solanacearum PSI07]|nr:hypothethical protein [Ralstonia solanacearum PSI07]
MDEMRGGYPVGFKLFSIQISLTILLLSQIGISTTEHSGKKETHYQKHKWVTKKSINNRSEFSRSRPESTYPIFHFARSPQDCCWCQTNAPVWRGGLPFLPVPPEHEARQKTSRQDQSSYPRRRQ